MFQYRLSIVVREGIVKPWFDRGLAGRVGSGMHAHTFFPKPEMAEDLFGHLTVVDKRDDAHFAGAVRTQQGVGFPYLLDEFAPLGRRNPPRLVLGDVNDLHRVICGSSLLRGAFVALAPHLVRVPTIVPDELEAFVRDVLGDGGDEVAGIEHLEPTAGRTADAKRRQ